MKTNTNQNANRLTRYAAALLASGAILTAGCANMATTASDVNSFGTSGGAVAGTVHGGNQVVIGAQVNLYFVGQYGIGLGAATAASGATPSATTGQLLAFTTTDSGGNFQFQQLASPTGTQQPRSMGGNQYQCGNQTDPLLYIEVKGGNTSGNASVTTTNDSAVFIAPVGYCSVSANSRLVISEVTTAAMAAAVGQSINPQTEVIGADGIAAAYVAINNAFKTVNNLVNPGTGLAITSKTLTGGATNTATGTSNVSAVTVTATPESAKLNTVANILSACVNQTNTNKPACTSLFSAAVPPDPAHSSQPSATFNAATDTLMAAVYMNTNQTDTTTANRTTLFNLQPATGAPYLPTISTVPSDWSIGINYASNSTCDAPAGSSKFFSNPYGLAVDGQGNVWISNTQSASSALVGLTSTGSPLACQSFGAVAAGGRSSTVVDDGGNVYYGDSSNNNLYRFKPSTGGVLNYATTTPPLAITADGSDAVFFTGVLNSTGRLFKILGAANATTTNSPVEISNVVGPQPYSAFPDQAGDIWIASGANYVTQAMTGTGGANFEGGYNSVQFTVANPAVSLAVSPGNNVYVASGDPAASITAFAPSGTTFAVKTGYPTATNAGGISNARSLYLDGGRNSWVANGTANTSSLMYSLSELENDGTPLSASGNANGGYQRNATYLNAPRGIVIDLAGNVWVTNDGNTNSVTEIVGAAVPIYQPYAFGLTNTRFQTVP